MIHVTGDCHGDLTKFKSSSAKKLGKGDTLLICGDFGFVWDGTKNESDNLKWLSKRKYTIAFVEGAHENFEMLAKYPTVDFMGGKARQISENIFQLIRGETFEIEGKTIFAFGGGDDEERDISDIHDCPAFERLPSEAECQKGRENLAKAGGKVDYIISYDSGFAVRRFLEMESNCFNNLHAFLHEISQNNTYGKWYFGCFHLDKRIPPAYYCVYKNIYNAETGKAL